jgi:hypothetical protein
MKTLRMFLLSCGVLLCALAATENVAYAQSTLFNIPSTDVLPEKKVYLEFDFISHFEDHEDGGFQAYIPRGVVGLGKNIEVGLNVSFTDAFAPNQPVEIQPNIKWRFYNSDSVAATAGAILYTPIANREGVDTFTLVYGNVSKKVSGKYGPRLTGGAYGLAGRADGLGTKGGAIVGYEQPMASRVAFVADWFSGKNRFGYVTPGLAFTLPKDSVFYAGYSIGNSGRKNNALFIYFGKVF